MTKKSKYYFFDNGIRNAIISNFNGLEPACFQGGANIPATFQELFTRGNLEKPVILILDEFDALEEGIINSLVGVFRNIYIRRQKELKKPPGERWALNLIR